MRLRLFRDLVLVVLFAVGTLVLAIYLVMTEVRQELAWGQISQATAQVREELRRLLEPTEKQLAILRDWGRAGDLNRDDIDALTRRLVPTLTHHSQLSGLIIADDSGSEYFLMRDEDRWLVRERAPGDDGRLRWHHWESGEDDVPWQDNGGYDPRRRSCVSGPQAGGVLLHPQRPVQHGADHQPGAQLSAPAFLITRLIAARRSSRMRR